MSLESDIERIARLRGKAPEAYKAKLDAPRQINTQLLASAFMGTPDTRTEMRAFDRLPKASRQFIRECPIWISSLAYASLLLSAPSEGSMIATMCAAVNERIESTSSRKSASTR